MPIIGVFPACSINCIWGVECVLSWKRSQSVFLVLTKRKADCGHEIVEYGNLLGQLLFKQGYPPRE